MRAAREYVRGDSSKAILVLLCLLAAVYLGHDLVSGRLAAIAGTGSPYEFPVATIARFSFLVFGFVVFGIMALRLDTEAMTAVIILSLPVLSGRGFSFVTLYTDTVGNKTALNSTSIMLVATFLVLLARDFTWIRRISESWIFRAFILLIVSAFCTQTYHLGVLAGLGITYVRVVQPTVFTILVSHFAKSIQGLRRVFACMLVSVLIGILLRHVSPQLTDPITGRVSAIGSWTIYGTILAAVLPMAICLWLTTKHLWQRIWLPVAALLLAMEVFLTQTRGAILALPALGLFLAVRRARWHVIVAMLLLLAAGTALSLDLEEMSGNRLYSLDPRILVRDPNVITRFARNAEAWQYIQRHPLTGLGLGKPTAESGFDMAFWVYNPYLAWGLSAGVVGLLAFLLIMLLSMIQSFRNVITHTAESHVVQVGVLIALVVWLINQLTTGDSLSYLQPVESVLFFYAVVGMAEGQRAARERGDCPDAALPDKLLRCGKGVLGNG